MEFLRRPRRTRNAFPDFLSPNATANRLFIIRGLASRERLLRVLGVIAILQHSNWAVFCIIDNRSVSR